MPVRYLLNKVSRVRLTNWESSIMTRTPLINKTLREKTPLKNKIISEPTPLSASALADSVDQHLLSVMQSLNMAVAVVAQARDQRFDNPTTMVSPRSVHEAMLHLKNAAQQLDLLRRSLGKTSE
jgi:hypothetical protein